MSYLKRQNDSPETSLRKLIEFTEQTAAEAAANYLETQGIESRVRDAASGWSVWVLKDEDLERAQLLRDKLSRDQLAAFERLPELQRRAEQARKQREVERRPVFAPRLMGGDQKPGPWGAGVAGLMAVSVLVAVLTGVGSRPLWGLYIAPVDLGRGVFLPIEWTQPWRLVTPIFLHFGLMHIVFNMMWLRQLGSVIEQQEGTPRLLSLVMVAAVLSNLAQYWVRGPHFGGMSGVNYALFAFCWMQARYAPNSGYRLSSGTTLLMMGWLILCGTGLMGPVANVAHAGGLIVGLAWGAPSFVRFARTYSIKTTFQKGSWEDLHVRGFARFRRLVLEPYLPLWFLAIALLVVYVDV